MKKAVFIPIVILLVLSGSSVFATTDADGDSERKALSDSLFAAGVDLYDMQRYDEAVALFAESDRIDKAILDSTSNRRDYSAMWLASCLYRLGDSVKAAEISPEYYRIQPVDRRLTVHSDSMSAIGMEYYNSENYTLALETFRNVSEIEKSVVGDCHIWYGNTVGTIARLYHLMSDSANAIMEFERYVDIVGVSFSKYGDVYLSAVGECAWACATLKDYERAIKYGLIAFDIADSFGLDSQKCDYAYFLAENYNKIGLSLSGKDERKYYQNALSYLNYCNPIDSNVVEFQKVIESNIGASFSAEAFENYKIGNYTEAIRLETDAKEILARVLGTEHPDYATSLNNLAGYNSSIGNYTEAIRLGTEAMEIRARVLGTEHPNYATTLSNLAFYNTSICNYTEAIRLGTEAMEIRARVLGTEHPNYATTLSNLAN